MFAAGEVEEYADNADDDPQIEVLVVESDRKHDAENRNGFAKCARDDQPGLDVFYLLFGYGLLLCTFSKNEGKAEICEGKRGEQEHHERIFGFRGLLAGRQDRLTGHQHRHAEEHELRQQKNEPDSSHGAIGLVDG